MAGRSRESERGRVIGRAGRKLGHDEWISRGLGEGQGKGQYGKWQKRVIGKCQGKAGKNGV